MSYIKEPKGVDFLVGPSTLTKDDEQAIHDAIANFKKKFSAAQLKIDSNEMVSHGCGKLRSKSF